MLERTTLFGSWPVRPVVRPEPLIPYERTVPERAIPVERMVPANPVERAVPAKGVLISVI